MSKDDSKEVVDQDAVNQEAVNQEAVNQNPVNQELDDQETLYEETLSEETLDQDSLYQETLDRKALDQETQEILDQDAATQKAVEEASALTAGNPSVFPVYIEFLCRGTVNAVTLFRSDDASRCTTAGIFNAIVFAAEHGLFEFQDRLMTAQILTDEPLSIPIWAEHYAKVERGNIFRDYVAQVIAYELGVFWGPVREVDRDEVADMLSGYTQLNGYTSLNGDVKLNGLPQLNGEAQPNGFTHVNGDTQPNGFTHVNGDTQPNGHAHTNGDTHLASDTQLLDDVLEYMKPIPGSTPTHPNIAPVCFYHLHPSGADCPDMSYPMSSWIM
ncbi:hypothetical protein VC83_01933 [Pseudogymnoascus destructans]|uniref:Uncharacterized protein n=2 Tax=Pseudogymnoascus destructans TaxID=655981 RepID=L8FVU6_PSED2|nr:uncharacterized protein VC83_01933 [Pseudogymnoascus destructans]ELR03891.1 hypothetical protein GMDG_06425 [Pseudogymnoascus destructans 20631-21]OAF61456.1 hypothetical protein VC83_01933 [Pseudogymnoascus destructans]